MTAKRDILLASDKHALWCAANVIYSITLNVKNPELYRVTLVYHGDQDEAHEALKEFEGTPVELRVSKGLNTFAHIPACVRRLTTPTFTRLELSKHVPADCTRVLYLDVDTLVVNDIDELFTMPMETTVAVVRSRSHINHPNIIHNVFNAGVMVIDYTKWLATNVEATYAKLMTAGVRSDEVTLNKVLSKDKTYISCAYNYRQCGLWCTLTEFAERELGDQQHIKIVHFQGRRKPWHNTGQELDDLWRMYNDRAVDREKQEEMLTATLPT
jgi:lipopolysaccharide biosynthesis glycosyltransferase